MNQIRIFENSGFGRPEVLCEGDRYFFPATEYASKLWHTGTIAVHTRLLDAEGRSIPLLLSQSTRYCLLRRKSVIRA